MRKRVIIVAIIFALIFSFFYYKNQKLGNTIIKFNEEKVIENILNGKFAYQAEAIVTVYSNKNENEYQLKMKENGENSLLEAIGDNRITGLRIENNGEDLMVKNTKLKLDKIYENYQEMTDNSLLLSSFAKDYQETDKKTEEEKEGTIRIKITLKNGNRYIKYKELYLDKNTGIPQKLVIEDSSNNPKIIIRYTRLEML